MISQIQKGLFDYITSLLDEYGLPVEFKYDSKLDILEGFRKSIRLRVENKEEFTTMVDGYKKSITANHTFGVFNRSPLIRSTKLSNNNSIQSFFRTVSRESSDIEFRNTYYGEVQFRCKVLFDDHKICDLFEMIYAWHFDSKHRSYQVDYDFGKNDSGAEMEPLEEVDYNVYFSPISSIDSLNESDLRYIDFDVKVEGPVFSPFYKGGGLIENIVVSIHAFNKSTKPTPNNASDSTKVAEMTFKNHYEDIK
jgi:hypothetical protein